MMDLFSIISTAAFLVSLVTVVRYFLKKQHELLTMYERTLVTPTNPILPEAHILSFAPVPLTIKGKTLYMQPLSADGYEVYTTKMMEFLVKYQKNLAALRWATVADIVDNKADVLKDWTSAMQNKQLVRDMQELIHRTFLRNKLINPNKISLRFIRKNWTWIETLQVWQMMWQVQVKSVEDFIEYLLTSQRAGADQQSAGSPFTKSPGIGPTKSQNGRLMPRYCSQNEQAKKAKE